MGAPCSFPEVETREVEGHKANTGSGIGMGL
jgi:hypothetical protein